LASTDRRPAREPVLPLFDRLEEVGAEPADPAAGPPLPDAPARAFAVDPSQHVVLEASAGTGKTRVLVDRYLRLLDAGVDPAHILAITFTRKAAAEMRERIITELRRAADRSPEGRARWRALRDRLGEVAISTIDAFCLSLLKEFPLEAGLSPDFAVADETEAAALMDEAIDRALRIARAGAEPGGELELLFASAPVPRLREGLGHLLGRRLVAPVVLARLVEAAPAGASVAWAVESARRRVLDALGAGPGGLTAFLDRGPVHDPAFVLLGSRIAALAEDARPDAAAFRAVLAQLEEYCLTKQGEPRKRSRVQREACYADAASRKAHGAALAAVAPLVAEARAAFTRDLNVLLARALLRLFATARRAYDDLLREHDVVDFTEALERARALLAQMDEFSQSRFRLESRYHHVLVDELQDTSRAQWELIELLIRSWGEGAGLLDDLPVPPTIFVVGDRKQSIYRFRDADVRVLGEAVRFIGALRPGASPRRSISTSFRSHPELLAFVNAVFAEIGTGTRGDAFRFGPEDAFPPRAGRETHPEAAAPLGVAVAPSHGALAEAVADEIVRLLGSATVRDRDTGERRPARSGDVAILFRVREGHREYERALAARGVPTYVYKGLGFFDADEIKDVAALLRFLAEPSSPLRVAAFLRSRLVRLSDPGLLALRDDLSALFTSADTPAGWPRLDEEDRRVVAQARASVAQWLGLVDRMPPADLADLVLAESAYAFETRGGRQPQARENLKKLRALLRRRQNRGYATMGRLAAHVDRLTAGDESNAAIDALDAVNLMTVHAAKGLEFPIVFVVNLGKGAGGSTPPVRVLGESGEAGGTGAGLVSIEGLDPRADEEEERREREETKRLLYVALTRARDRLYLGTTLTRDGRVVARPGSLAEALPASFRDALASAAQAGGDTLTWLGAGSRPFSLRRCPLPDERPSDSSDPPPPAPAQVAPAEGLFGPVADSPGWAMVGATELARAATGSAGEGGTGDVVVGRLVHRLFEAGAVEWPAAQVRERAGMLARAGECGSDPEAETAIASRAAEAVLACREREDLREMLTAGDVLYEVPFSVPIATLGPPFTETAAADPDLTLVRGVIDCLVRGASGVITVLEFKTGSPAEWHRAQLALYEAAARAIAPGAPVAGRLVYL
jgi:ATP-dependent helicase/nuclease subunit A